MYKRVVRIVKEQKQTGSMKVLRLEGVKVTISVDISWLAAGEAEIEAAISLGVDEKDVLKVGGTGSHMMSAMRQSSLKSSVGFSQVQRNVSVA